MFFIVAMLIATLIPPGLKWESALAMDCTGSCRSAYQWTGGTIGNQAIIDVPSQQSVYGVACYVGCTQVWRGIWSKNTDSTRYIFVGIENTRTTSKYMYGIWRPNAPFEWIDLGNVPSGDQNKDANIATYVSGNVVRAYVNSPNFFTDVSTSMEDRIFWSVLVGYRIWAAENTAIIGYFNSDGHMWQCGCDGRWWYQASDPTPTIQNSRMIEGWKVLPHVSSTGGTYEAQCGNQGGGSPTNCP